MAEAELSAVNLRVSFAYQRAVYVGITPPMSSCSQTQQPPERERQNVQRRALEAVLQAMSEIVEDAEHRPQPGLIGREFARLRAEAVALHASCYPGPPDGGEIALLCARAAGAGLYHQHSAGRE